MSKVEEEIETAIGTIKKAHELLSKLGVHHYGLCVFETDDSENPVTYVTTSYGVADDQEPACAKAVAKALGYPMIFEKDSVWVLDEKEKQS